MWNIFEKKMTLIADVFPKLGTSKPMSRSIPKKSRFKGSVQKQHGTCAKTLFNFEGHLLYHIYWSLRKQLPYKKALLLICKISKLFRNTLSADGKYSLLHRDNLTQPIQMQFSQKQKSFSQFFLHFWNLVSIWNIFKKKMTLLVDAFSKVPTPKNMVRSMPKKSPFRGSVEKQHGKCARTLFKIEGHFLYHLYWLLRRQLPHKKGLLVIFKISKHFPNALSADGKYSLLDGDNLTQRIQM